MVPDDFLSPFHDPADLLDHVLERAWTRLCAHFDLTGAFPSLPTLFEGADFSEPETAAQVILVNMLAEIMESVGRFSPWYRQPARAYGMVPRRDPVGGIHGWTLAPEAIEKWGSLLESLSTAIQKNSGLIQAMLLVDSLMMKSSLDDPCVFASCACTPTRTVRIKESIYSQGEIICDACHQRFQKVEDFQHWVLEDLRKEQHRRMLLDLRKAMTIRQLMEAQQGAPLETVWRETPVIDVLRLMAGKNLGAVSVVDDDGHMVGIFTERDYARKIILMGRSSLDTAVKDIMTQQMVTIDPDSTLEEGLTMMSQHYIRHLPVMEGRRLVGLVSMRDIMTALIGQKDTAIDALEKLILGE